MGRRSSIDDLAPELRLAVDKAVAAGVRIDDIHAMLEELGADVSRSAVGRYSQRYREIAAQQRNVKSIAEAFASDFGEDDNKSGKLLLQMLNSIFVRAMIPMASGDLEEVDAKELHFLMRSAKDLIAATKIDTDRDAIILKRTKERAAQAAEDEGRAAGVSEETLQKVKARILGIEL